MRWWSVIGATVPCCDSATAASEVILAFGVARVDDEDQRLAGALAQIDRGADGAQVVRARASRHDDQLGDADDRLDRHGDRRRRVDHRELEALLAQSREIAGEPSDGGMGESGIFGLALVPPVGERALRVDVDEHDRAGAGALRLHGQVPRERRLARPALLRSQCQNAQGESPKVAAGGKNSGPSASGIAEHP